MRKHLFTSFTLVMCMALILVAQAQAQVTIDENGDVYVEKGLKGSFPGAAIVIDGDGYLNIETRLNGNRHSEKNYEKTPRDTLPYSCDFGTCFTI